RTYRPRDRRLLLDAEVGDPGLRQRPLVVAGPIADEIAERSQPEPLEPLLDRRADARQDVDGALQLLSALERARPRPRVRRSAREAHGQLYCDCRHSLSSNQQKPTVPAPACVPTTAPSVVITSISACGRSWRTIFC